MDEVRFVLVPEEDSWKSENNGKMYNIFWMQGCPDVALETILERDLGFMPKKGDIDALRYPKQYEINVTSRSRDE